jgi:hypothetical protein
MGKYFAPDIKQKATSVPISDSINGSEGSERFWPKKKEKKHFMGQKVWATKKRKKALRENVGAPGRPS